MNKLVKRIALLLIISIMFLSIGSAAVYAQSNIGKAIQPVFDMLSSILNTQVKLPHPQWVDSGEKVSLWLLFAVFALIFAPVFVVVKNKIPIFKDHKGPSVVFSIAIAAMVVFGTGLVETIGLVVGGGAALAGMGVVVFLIFYGFVSIYKHWHGVGAGFRKVSAEHNKEVAESRKAKAEIDRAGLLERKEDTALRRVRGLAAGVRGAGAALTSRLEHIRDELEHAQSLSSEQAMNIFRTEAKAVAGLISGQVPAVYRTLTQITADEGLLEAFDNKIMNTLNNAKQTVRDMQGTARRVARIPANRTAADTFSRGPLTHLITQIDKIENLIHGDIYRHEETKRDVVSMKGLVQRFEGEMKALEADLMAPNPQAAMNRASALLHLLAEMNSAIGSVAGRLTNLARLEGTLKNEMRDLRGFLSAANTAVAGLP